MNAVEFLRERRRMCNAQDDCGTCPIGVVCADYFVNHNYSQEKSSGMVSTVEQWAKEHPIKTRKSVFFEQWPDARIHKEDGLPMASPCDLDCKLASKCKGIPCPECRKKFWLAEVEDV